MLGIDAQAPSINVSNHGIFLQWYLGNDPRTGRERRRPLDGSLLGDEGLGLAVRFIQWIGTNMKNYNYKGKAKELVMHSASGGLIPLLSASIWTDTGFFMQTISILEAVHSALQNRYSDQQMMKEGRSRNDVSLQSWQIFQKFVVLML